MPKHVTIQLRINIQEGNAIKKCSIQEDENIAHP